MLEVGGVKRKAAAVSGWFSLMSESSAEKTVGPNSTTVRSTMLAALMKTVSTYGKGWVPWMATTR